MIAAQLMSRNVVTCHPQASLQEAAQKMWDGDMGCVPVLDDESRLVGMLTDRDVCMAAYTQGLPLHDISVVTVMAHPPLTCRSGATIEEVERLMKDHRIRRVPIVEADGTLVGLISMNDLARESDRERDSPASEVPSASLVSTLAAVCQPRRPSTLAVAAE